MSGPARRPLREAGPPLGNCTPCQVLPSTPGCCWDPPRPAPQAAGRADPAWAHEAQGPRPERHAGGWPAAEGRGKPRLGGENLPCKRERTRGQSWWPWQATVLSRTGTSRPDGPLSQSLRSEELTSTRCPVELQSNQGLNIPAKHSLGNRRPPPHPQLPEGDTGTLPPAPPFTAPRSGLARSCPEHSRSS